MNKHRCYLYIVVLLLLIVAGGCSFSPAIKIDKDSVKVVQGKYNYDSIDLTFYADLTGYIAPEWTYYSKADGRFHRDTNPKSCVTLAYEVFNPFGELDLKAMCDAAGQAKTAQLPLPVFWSEDLPYEYTLRVTFYYNGKKQDCYTARFRLTLP